ncbi:MAG TPA: sigma-70 family RNA polymerase sigma factor [Labilithrix sp.]|nr:sigma-70 family RNA polymerase sigma factor [Labilithrix sp.]
MGAGSSVRAFAFIFRGKPRPRPADAFAERLSAILSAHFDGAWLFARRLGVHEGDLDDVMQEVGTIVAARLETIKVGSEKSFVFGTVFRVASEARRRRMRRREVDEELAADTVDDADRPDEVHERREARALLDRILEAMPIELRAVFVLFEIEERSQIEIAEILALPVGTVASRMRRAREDFDARVARWQAQSRGRE